MKSVRTTLFVLLFFYLALLVGVSLNYERASNWMNSNQDYLPYFTLSGLGIFLLIFIISVYERSRYTRKIARQEAEKNEIKARVYEIERRNTEIERSMQSFESSIAKREEPREPTNTNQNL